MTTTQTQFQQFQSTMMYCPGPLCRQEREHHRKVRYTRPAHKLGERRSYTCWVCEACGRESGIEGGR